MFRGFLGIVAGLLVGVTASSAATGSTDDALAQRIARAQVTIAALDELAKGKAQPQEVSSESGKERVAQHWHNWNNWHNHWNNWRNHWHNHHHHH